MIGLRWVSDVYPMYKIFSQELPDLHFHCLRKIKKMTIQLVYDVINQIRIGKGLQ